MMMQTTKPSIKTISINIISVVKELFYFFMDILSTFLYLCICGCMHMSSGVFG